ncbi:Carboxynorspermidine/carboxyspermidine decarboxylase [uncultured Desulfobacterium sp.]|uniref:Carboxynorspermidine/carboxyspermidine decarboxylase n=1 Tax=uncultured Desulfobacterium sp. TaxID=201089 RepID=A0A445MVY1_9BACT|nr:Carboxynorspermidine/carboxyspermidine decarboxylase [uncultured Desulfobacterium sp.]
MDRGLYPIAAPGLDLSRVPTPCFVLDLAALKRNLDVLKTVQDRTGCLILLALKGFAMFSVFPLVRRTLKGVCASSPHEAILGKEEFSGEAHAFAAAYSASDIKRLVTTADVIVFNSFTQWQRFKQTIAEAERKIRCGIRINPAHSEVSYPLYNPCAPRSRLGVRSETFKKQAESGLLDGITGLHFHTLCEKNADALERTLKVIEEKFGEYISRMTWVNFGGGHLITRRDYDIDLLCRLIDGFKKRYDVEVYLEPGEAVALNAGILVASVLDIVDNDGPIAILDTSATTHMPDVLEMPYRPEIAGAGLPNEKPYTYRLAGLSCLAGDIIGDYSFDKPLAVGDRLAFQDMAHYSMVKTNTFNGIQLPSIATYDPESDEFTIIREFGYADYKNRLS